jgi:hypothetical protein
MLVPLLVRLYHGCKQSVAGLLLRMRMVVGLDPSRVCGQMMYARWNGDTGTFEQETETELQLLPVSKRLQQTWREAYRAGRCRDIEWEWKQPGSMPGAEDAGDDVAQVYDEVRAAIKLGETLFPRGATSTDKAMHSYHSGWKETYGVYQTNTALRDGHQTEYEAFFGPDVADGLQEAWRRPMHWAGFLVMGASTRLPRGDAKEGGAGMKGWTIEQVETFVQGLAHEFGEKANVYAETLKREDVNGETLLGLSEDDLKDLGFSLGHRRQLLACIQRSS